MPQKTPKTLRIIRVVTTTTDVDLDSYFDFHPAGAQVGENSARRQWTAEEAMAYEKGRGQADQMEAFELALQNDEMIGHLIAFDIITGLPEFTEPDERTADEKAADEHQAVYLTPSRDTEQAGYEENPRAGLLST